MKSANLTDIDVAAVAEFLSCPVAEAERRLQRVIDLEGLRFETVEEAKTAYNEVNNEGSAEELVAGLLWVELCNTPEEALAAFNTFPSDSLLEMGSLAKLATFFPAKKKE